MKGKVTTPILVAIVVIVVAFVGLMIALTLTNNLDKGSSVATVVTSFVSSIVTVFLIQHVNTTTEKVPEQTITRINGNVKNAVKEAIAETTDCVEKKTEGEDV